MLAGSSLEMPATMLAAGGVARNVNRWPTASQFSDRSTDPDDDIEEWSWTFGDGGSSDAQNPTDVYPDDGTYQARLTVTDSEGLTDSATKPVTVTNLPSRPAPVLARTLTSLSALSGGRVILGIGAGAIWDMITKLGVPRLDGGSAVRAMAGVERAVERGGLDATALTHSLFRIHGLRRRV